MKNSETFDIWLTNGRDIAEVKKGVTSSQWKRLNIIAVGEWLWEEIPDARALEGMGHGHLLCQS